MPARNRDKILESSSIECKSCCERLMATDSRKLKLNDQKVSKGVQHPQRIRLFNGSVKAKNQHKFPSKLRKPFIKATDSQQRDNPQKPAQLVDKFKLPSQQVYLKNTNYSQPKVNIHSKPTFHAKSISSWERSPIGNYQNCNKVIRFMQPLADPNHKPVPQQENKPVQKIENNSFSTIDVTCVNNSLNKSQITPEKYFIQTIKPQSIGGQLKTKLFQFSVRQKLQNMSGWRPFIMSQARSVESMVTQTSPMSQQYSQVSNSNSYTLNI